MIHSSTGFEFYKVPKETSAVTGLLNKLHLNSPVKYPLTNDGFGARIGRNGEDVERLAP